MPLITQEYSRIDNHFSANHFLVGYSKCERLHGHNYQVKIQIIYHLKQSAHTLDFRIVNAWINQIIEKLDHKILLPASSPKIQISSDEDERNWIVKTTEKEYSFPKKDVQILESVDQTTAENLAFYLHTKLAQKIKTSDLRNCISTLKVMIEESIGNVASYEAAIENDRKFNPNDCQ